MGAIVANTNHLLADALMAAANKLYQPEPYKWRKSSEYPAVGTEVICYHKDTGGYLFGRREFGRWEAEVDGFIIRYLMPDLPIGRKCRNTMKNSNEMMVLYGGNKCC